MDPENLEQAWASILALQTTNDLQQAEVQARQYLSQPDASVEHVAELLAWALELPLEDNGRSLAEQVAAAFMNNPAVASLCVLICSPEPPAKAADASAVVSRLQPEVLSKWNALMVRAYLLKAQCLEVVGDWTQMADQAEKAASLGVEKDQANYWWARALLHLGDVPAAARALGPRPLIGLKRWVRLSHIINSQSNTPELPLLDACVQVLEGKWGQPEPGEKELVVQGLERALNPRAGGPSVRVDEIMRYNDRLTTLVGPLPSLQFSLTLKELRESRNFERQLARLNRSEGKGPTNGYMPQLLRLICSLIIGRHQEYANCLDRLPVLPETYARDLRFFQAMHVILGMLEKNAPLLGSQGLLEDLTGVQESQLGKELPILAAIGMLCRSLFTDQALPVSMFQALDGCGWAQWLWLRSWALKETSPEEVNSFLLETDLGAPALLWDEFAWIQEFQAFLPPEGQGRFQERLLDYRADLASLSPYWQEQVALRATLANENTDIPTDFSAAPLGWIDINPWWVEDHFLQEMVKVDQQIETFYLRGRLALRRVDLAGAWECFEEAQALCARANLTGRLSLAGRFVSYWQGVTQARLGHYQEGAKLLEMCLTGPKALEASAQLGMISLAQGKLPEAQSWLEKSLAAQELPAVRYLRAVLIQEDNPVEAMDQLASLESAGKTSNAGYTRAAYRLHAAIQERSGDLESASRSYRHIIETQPADDIASLRLARLWAYRKYEALRTGEGPAVEPLPSISRQDTAAIPWAPALTDLVRSLQQIEETAGAGVPVRLPARPAHQRLFLRAILATGNPAKALARLQAPAGSQEEKFLEDLRHLARLGDLLGTYLQAEPEAAQQILDQMTAQLQSL